MSTILPEKEPTPATVPYAAVTPKLWRVGTLVYTSGGLVLLFVWLLWGDFALSMRERSVGPLVELFLLRHGASNFLKQLLTATLPTIIALVLGPIVSYQSDRYRSRWGRRIPFLLIPTPIAGLAMVAIAFSPQMGTWLYTAMGNIPKAGQTLQQAADPYILSVFTVFWTIFEVAVIISGAVLGGLINDVVPRPVLGRFHGLFRAISLYDGILFNAILFKHAEYHFTLMFAIIGILFGGGFTLMCLKVREGEYPPPPAEDPVLAQSRDGFLGWLAAFFNRFFSAAMSYLRECYTQPYYLLCFAMFTLAALTFNPINSFTFRYKDQLGMGTNDYGFLIAASYLCSLIIAFPLGMIVDKVHAFRASIAAVVLYSVTALYGSLFITDPTTFGIALVAHTILSGTYFTCAASLPQQLFPRSKYSQYASAGGIITSLTVLLFAPSIGYVLDKTNNNYRLTFWAGFIISLMTLGVMLLVYRRFKTYGGTKDYLAPGDPADSRSQHEPPKHLLPIISLYMVGALSGGAVGYLIASVVHRPEDVSFAHFPALLLEVKDIRDLVLFWIASGVLPGAVVGAVAGNKWAQRRYKQAVV